MGLVVDPQGLAKKAQVGIDLTIAGAKKIAGGDAYYLAGPEEIGYVYNDASGLKASYGAYDPVEIREIAGHKMYIFTKGAYSITFDQGLNALPADKTAFIYQRSTLGRNGALLRSSVFDPGFATPSIGAILEVWRPICIEEHSRIAQIVIYDNELTELYDGQYQKEKDYKG
jgi:deoxycytidine triphosphate deaminase